MEDSGGLLQRARLGDWRAFEDVLRPLIEPAYRLAFAMLGEREAAEDAVQEMALKGWRHRTRIRPELGTARPWFLAIVANECRMARRQRWWSVLRFAEPPVPASVENDLARRIDLGHALDRLPQRDRLLLHLYYVLDLPLEEGAGPRHWRRRHEIEAASRRAAAAPGSGHGGGIDMSDHELGLAIRDVFDRRHVASPGLDQRVLEAIPWEQQPAQRSGFRPRLAGAFAIGLAALLVAALAAPSVLSRLGLLVPGSNGSEVYYSLAAVDGHSVFVIQRGAIQQTGSEGNVLIESSDGGRTWSRRLGFDGAYDGMQMFGNDGFVWAIEMSLPPCSVQPCAPPPNTLIAFRTTDGGATWKELPKPAFLTEDAFFLDGEHGWAVAYRTGIGLGNETLYATADGGSTWVHVADLPHSQPNGMVYGVGGYRVTFSDQQTGWFVGNGQLFGSRDAGVSWQPIALDPPAAVAGWMVSPSQPVFKGQNGIVGIGYRDPKGADNATATRVYFYVSTDGGRTWGDPRQAPDATTPVGDDWVPTYLDPGHVWLTSLSLSGGDNVQSGPAVARSSDAGRTWKVATGSPRILTMLFTDADHGYGEDVSGPTNTNGIVATADAGATWYRVNVPTFN